MKDILVIDTPKKCFECPLMSEEMYCKAYAYIVKGKKLCVEDDVLHGTINIGCPLKPQGLKTKTDGYVLYSTEYLTKHLESEYMLWKELYGNKQE